MLKKNYLNNEMDCPKCGWPTPLEEFHNKDGFKIYHECRDCRNKALRKRQAKRRARIKEEQKALQSHNTSINRDRLLKARSYLISQAGTFCQPCGQDYYNSLTIVPTDGRSLKQVLEQHLESINPDSWAAVVDVYQECVLMCLVCERKFYDGNLEIDDDYLWKINPSPPQPDLEQI